MLNRADVCSFLGGIAGVHVTFEDWTKRRSVPSLGTNAGADELPFQSWRHFKEAFAPELIARAVAHSKRPVSRCIDPFGGSGTTSLACQFLGVHPITMEVNPFLADLIEAKLVSYDTDALARDLGTIVRRSNIQASDLGEALVALPPTFIEPGVSSRWIFDRSVADRITGLLNAIDTLTNAEHRRLFRVLLGGILVEVSNVVVNGKGRRYRRGWERRNRDPQMVDELFCDAAQRAIGEVHRFGRRVCSSYDLHRGDSRELLGKASDCELAVFSPPYPNSFDYTDVYNLELWVLGYLTDSGSNQALRQSTLCSHVQVARDFSAQPIGSKSLSTALKKLRRRRTELWDHRIPEMVSGYFADMLQILEGLRKSVIPGGSVWMVVGDSQYAEVQVQTGSILVELARSTGWKLEFVEPCRSMRASAQQGGSHKLAETLIVLRNDD